jgi:hypothetical protein
VRVGNSGDFFTNLTAARILTSRYAGLILRRGHELDRVLLAIDRKLAVV